MLKPIKPVNKITMPVSQGYYEGACGNAVLAMLLGKTLKWAASRYPDLAKNGIHIEMMRSLLTVHTYHYWHGMDYEEWATRNPKGNVLSEFRTLHKWTYQVHPAALLIHDLDFKHPAHWVAVSGSTFFDPSPGAAYEQGHGWDKIGWYVVAAITRGKPLESYTKAS